MILFKSQSSESRLLRYLAAQGLSVAGLTLFGPLYHPINQAQAIDFPTAEDKAVPCRPTVSCTADLAPAGTTELEAGTLYHSDGAPGNLTSFPFLTKFTFANWSQLQIGSNGYTISKTSGEPSTDLFDDLYAGPKFHFFDQTQNRPSVAFSVEGSFPTSHNQDGYVRAYDTLFTLYVSKDFGPIHADFNSGFSWLSIGNSPVTQEFVSLALTYGLSSRWSLEAESYYFTDASPIASKDAGFRSALTYACRQWLIFDFGGDIGYVPSTRIYSAFAGLTVVPATMWRAGG